MFSNRTKIFTAGWATLVLLVPLFAASGCGTGMDQKADPQPEPVVQAQIAPPPPPPAPISLLSQTRQCTQFIDASGVFRCGLALFFNPNRAGSTITVEVSANLTDSRPAFQVADANNNMVAVEQLPVSNRVSKSFTSQNTTSHRISISELINLNSNYTVTVTEQP